jgi:hypothetical protein
MVVICAVLLTAMGKWAVSAALSGGERARKDTDPASSRRTAKIVIAQSPGDVAPSPPTALLVSDAEIVLGTVSDELLATGLVERATPEQLASREKGYLRADALSGIQMDAVCQIARRHGLMDAQGQLAESGATLRVGIWQTWQAYVSRPGEGATDWYRLSFALRPPTPDAIIAPPLAESVLLQSWPYPAPSTGLTSALRSLEMAAEQGSEPDALGWHLCDLPLLYRNVVEEEWERTVELESETRPPSLDPNRTDVLWTKGILVSVMLQQEDGSGGGVEIVVPAF